MRRIQVAVGTLAGGAVLGLLANALGLAGPLLYGFGGAALAVAVLVGTPYAFPTSNRPSLPRERLDVMETDKPAIPAENGFGSPSLADGDTAIGVPGGLDERRTLTSAPGRMATHGTVPPDAPAVEVRLELVELGLGHPV